MPDILIECNVPTGDTRRAVVAIRKIHPEVLYHYDSSKLDAHDKTCADWQLSKMRKRHKATVIKDTDAPVKRTLTQFRAAGSERDDQKSNDENEYTVCNKRGLGPSEDPIVNKDMQTESHEADNLNASPLSQRQIYVMRTFLVAVLPVLLITILGVHVVVNSRVFTQRIIFSSVTAIFAYVGCVRLIPPFAKRLAQRGLSGRDLNKAPLENGSEPLLVPESLGLVVAVNYILCTVISQLLFSYEASKLLEFNAGLLAVAFVSFLGFVDDVLDLRWRYKLVLPVAAAVPLVITYQGSTSVIVPKFLSAFIGGRTLIDLGIFYLFYMTLLTVFCTNAINIYAGINGLEVGQSLIMSWFVIAEALLGHKRPPLRVCWCCEDFQHTEMTHNSSMTTPVACQSRKPSAPAFFDLWGDLFMQTLKHTEEALALPHTGSDPSGMLTIQTALRIKEHHGVTALQLVSWYGILLCRIFTWPQIIVSATFVAINYQLRCLAACYGWRAQLIEFFRFPACVFVGDTYTYFAGAYFAIVGILGHFSKTLIFFFVPQLINFVLSLPQLLGLIPCPRHRVPKLDPETGLLRPSMNLTLINAVLYFSALICHYYADFWTDARRLSLPIICCACVLAVREQFFHSLLV